MAGIKHEGKGNIHIGDTNTTTINNYLTPWGVISFLITLTSFVVSMPQINIHIPQIDILSIKIRGLVMPLKLVIFFISEIANGYFFGSMLRIIIKKKIKEDYAMAISLTLLCIVLSAFISILFLVVTVFPEIVEGYKIFGLFILYLISFIVTVVNVNSQLIDMKYDRISGDGILGLIFLVALFYIIFFVGTVI